MAELSFIGLGVVGLVTQTCFASRGFSTIGVDADQQKLRKLQGGIIPFYEPQLEEMFKEVRPKMMLSDDISYAVNNSRFTFVTVGTPSLPDGSIELSQISDACKMIGRALRNKPDYHIIVAKSTVVPTSTNNVIKNIVERESGKSEGIDFGIVVNPEFLREGSAVYDTFNPHLLVIGSSNERSANEVERLWSQFCMRNHCKVIKTNWVTAELIKYSNNAFLATKVSFINTIANICQQLEGADIEKVAEAIGTDPRIGPLFLKAGPGYGGSCLPKDLKALINLSHSIGYDSPLLLGVDKVNENQPAQILRIMKNAMGSLENKVVAILGVAFKKDTDDIRESASVKIIQTLLSEGTRIKVHDPMALENLRKVFSDKILYAKDRFECLQNADCCVVLTEWDEYKSMKPDDFVKHMKRPCIIDARRIFNPDDFIRELKYFAIGLNPDR